MSVTYRLLTAGDVSLLLNVTEGLFDGAVDAALADKFVKDPRHHIAVAIDGNGIVGFASAIDYIHPDKPRQLWINELSVRPQFQRLGIGKRLLALLLEEGGRLGCTDAWVLTDRDNDSANALFRSAGAAQRAEAIMFTWDIGE